MRAAISPDFWDHRTRSWWFRLNLHLKPVGLLNQFTYWDHLLKWAEMACQEGPAWRGWLEGVVDFEIRQVSTLCLFWCSGRFDSDFPKCGVFCLNFVARKIAWNAVLKGSAVLVDCLHPRKLNSSPPENPGDWKTDPASFWGPGPTHVKLPGG